MLAVTVLTATAHDVCFNKDEEKPVDSQFAIQLLQCFSARRNCATLFKMSENSKDDLSCIHGIRVLAICWIVLIHTGGVIAVTRLLYNQKMTFEVMPHRLVVS